ncbi:MAG: hypothetical protein JXR31_05430 [Prolixibacteraceae bacterium]|nr:hypothetical protein [Prolixibacteraceae bacterium]MBN2773669.1 hypothetical protein [Prolixibacteraceae bacterium]
MKTKVLFVVFLFFIIWGCQENNDTVFLQQTGTVIDYSGSGNCGFVVELDDGNNIIPINYPEGFEFAQGQKVWVEYTEMPDVIMLCEKGIACEINRIEQLGCAPYVDLYFSNYDSLARDPVYIHSVNIDGDCLHIKLSYSGGCEEHDIDLARMHPWCATPPLPPPTFEIRHNSHGDMCEALITREFRFDLSPLKEEGAKTFTVNALLTNNEVYHETFDYNW